MTGEQKQSFINIIRSCDDVILATHRLDAYPDARTIINIFNHEITDLDLHFFTSTKWKTSNQIKQDEHVCLYYFNPVTRMSLRFFGTIIIVDDMREKQNRFMPEIKRFGITGFDDTTYLFLRFIPKGYKYYIGFTEYAGVV